MLITAPSPRSAMCSSAACPTKYAPFRFASSVSSNCSSVTSPTGTIGKIPAAFTSTSTRPNSEIARLTRLRQSSTRSWWLCTKSARPPFASMPSATSRPRPASRPASTTLAPSRANASAMPRPMPEVPPVTTATFPSRRFILWSRDAMRCTSDRLPGGDRECAVVPRRRRDPEDLTRLRRRRDLAVQLTGDPNSARDRLAVAGELPAAAVVDVVLQADADVAAEEDRRRRHRQLELPDAADGEDRARGQLADEREQILQGRVAGRLIAHHELVEVGRLEQPLGDQVLRHPELTGLVDLELRLDVV